MNFDNILPFCEVSPLPFDCCEESMQFANFCSNYEPLWFLPVLTSDGVLSLLQNEFASLRQPAHYAVQRYGIIISSRSLLQRRPRSRRRRSNSFPQKIRIPPAGFPVGGFRCCLAGKRYVYLRKTQDSARGRSPAFVVSI